MEVPFFKQTTDYTCGPACMKMIMKYYGKDFSERHLKKVMKTSRKDGTDHSELIHCATSKGFYCYVNRESDLKQVKGYVDLKFPVVVNFLDGKEGHYAVVVGYEKNKLVLNDPFLKRRSKIGDKTFEKRWRSKDGISRWMMVVSKDDLKFGKEYKPR